MVTIAIVSFILAFGMQADAKTFQRKPGASCSRHLSQWRRFFPNLGAGPARRDLGSALFQTKIHSH